MDLKYKLTKAGGSHFILQNYPAADLPVGKFPGRLKEEIVVGVDTNNGEGTIADG